MSRPIIALIEEKDISSVSELLNNNGFESRYSIFSKNQLLHLDENQFIQYYQDYGYDTNLLKDVINEIISGNVGVVIHYDYEDLPGIYEILNSFGYTTVDTLQVTGSVFDSYHIYEGENRDKENNSSEEKCISINVPAHFIQDPSIDQEIVDNSEYI